MAAGRLKILLVIVAVVVIGTVVTCITLRRPSRNETYDRYLVEAKQALKAGEERRAEFFLQHALRSNPRSSEVLLLAAQIARRKGKLQEATSYLLRVTDKPSFVQSRLECGAIALELGNLTLAEQSFREVLAQEAFHEEAAAKLIELLRIEGRNWESRPLIEEFFRRKKYQRDHLYVALSSEWVWLDARELEFLEHSHSRGQNGLLPLLGPVRRALTQDATAAKPLEVLERLSSVSPPVIEAIAWYGALLAQANRDDEFRRWQSDSARADQHPQTWFARGIFLERHGNPKSAARCYWEAVQRDINHRAAVYQLGRMLSQLSPGQRAAQLLERAKLLAEVDQLVHIGEKTKAGELATATIVRLVEVLNQLGRQEEARGWVEIGIAYSPDSPQLNSLAEKLRETASTLAIAKKDMELDLRRFPLPSPDLFQARIDKPGESNERDLPLKFVDDAPRLGLRFNYFNGAPPEDERGRMFEFSGGGVGVVDFDCDGFPDLYCSQGAAWPVDPTESHLDRLFLNDEGRGWRDITEFAHIAEERFSNGVTVGDFNGDGFPDIYISNLGANRLLENCGDGTFRDVTEHAGVAGDEWSLSSAFADFNDDSIMDLCVINYLGGADVLSRICEHEGKPVQCRAAFFQGEKNRFYLGLGDGRFRDISIESGMTEQPGKGMGVVAGDFSGQGVTSLYIANDGLPNTLWQVETSGDTNAIHLVDVGLSSGVGTNFAGQSQASMGIAAADVNHDGVLDFFVTNFYKEESNLFLSEGESGYSDQVWKAKLNLRPAETMGWGAQFFDPDLDGDQDLVVANGHLGLRSSRGDPNRMPTMLWRNVSSAKGVRFEPAEEHEYFAGRYLGRSIATLDWNRDGKRDVCVTHVDHSLALLTNTTECNSHFVAVQLVGRNSNRDAIGAIVEVESDGQTRFYHVTSGDGFEVTNDRILTIGLGSAPRVERMRIQWPSGEEQTITSVEGDRFYVAIEGNENLVPQVGKF